MKPLLFLFCAALLSITLLSSASAALVLEQYTYTAHAQPGQDVVFNFQFKNTGDIDLSGSFTGVNVNPAIKWSASSPEMVIAAGQSKTTTMSATLVSRPSDTLETYLLARFSPAEQNASGLISLIVALSSQTPSPTPQTPPSSNSNQTTPSGATLSSFCATGPKGTNLTIDDVKIRSSGKKTTWLAGDTLELEVAIENTGGTTLDDVIVELGLRESNGNNKVKDLKFKNSDEHKVNIGNIRSGDDDETVFTFTIPSSLDAGNYQLVLKAYDKGAETSVCTDKVADFDRTAFQTIEVEREDDEGKFIKFEEVTLSPIPLVCGASAQLTAKVINVGDEDQDRVKVTLKSTKAKLDLVQEIRSGLDEGDDARIIFSFTLPESTTEETYDLELSAEYNYRNSIYRGHSDEPYRTSFSVAQCEQRRSDVQSQPTIALLTGNAPEVPANERDSSQVSFTLPWILSAGVFVLIVLIIIVSLTRNRLAVSPPPVRHKPSRGKTLHS